MEKVLTVPVRAVVSLLLDKCKFDGAIQLEPSVLTRPLRGLIHSRPTAARAKSGCAGCRTRTTKTTGEGDANQDCEGNRARVDHAQRCTRCAHAQSVASGDARPGARITRALCARMAATESTNGALSPCGSDPFRTARRCTETPERKRRWKELLTDIEEVERERTRELLRSLKLEVGRESNRTWSRTRVHAAVRL